MKYPELCLEKIEAIVDKLGGIAGADRFLAGNTTVVDVLPEQLLVPIGVWNVPETTEEFVFGDMGEGPIITSIKYHNQRIHPMWEFRDWFRSIKPNSATKVRVHQILWEGSYDSSSITYPKHKAVYEAWIASVIAELGGEAMVETTLAEVFALMQGQSEGQLGPLALNGGRNLFFVRDKDGILRLVACYGMNNHTSKELTPAGWEYYSWYVGASDSIMGLDRVITRVLNP